jgi:SAM-dependent methyltransferase
MTRGRTEAFGGIAADYDRFRPRYPQVLLAAVLAAAPAGPERLFVDIGCGSGISTRQLRRTVGSGPRVLGLEPGWDMRHQAVRATPVELRIAYAAAIAEAMPLGPRSVDLLLAAQAVQWFDRPRFYAEAAAVLRVGGILALLENNRSWRESEFLDAYETFLESASPGYSRRYRDHDYRSEISRSGRLRHLETRAVSWTLPLSESEFIAASETSTKVQAAIGSHGREQIVERIRELLRRHSEGGKVEIPYRSVLHLFTAW